MKKSLLLSAALVAAGTALAGAPAFQKASPSALTERQNVQGANTLGRKLTRAEGDMQLIDFTYASGIAGAYSLNGTTGGKTRVYLGFEMTAEDIKRFKGSKVTGFNVLSPAANQGEPNTITEARFFYTFDLEGEDYSQEFTMSTNPVEENRITMTEPYTITGEEERIIFGYSFIVPEKNDMGYLITDGQNTEPYTCLFGNSDTSAFPDEFYTVASQVGALCMSITLEVEDFPKSVSFTTFPEDICLVKGEPLSFPITLSATSLTPIESISLEYTLGGNLNEFTYSSASPMPGGIGLLLNVNLDFLAQTENLNETVEFRLTKINGEDNICDGNRVSADVVVIDKAPVHQTLYEEYTGTWCGYCPRGFAALEFMGKNYPEFVTASFHYGSGSSTDPMQVLDFYPSNVNGFPSAVLNRNTVVDPYYGTESYDGLVPVVGDMQALNAMPTPWKVDVTHEWESEDLLVAKAEVANMAGFDNKNFKIAYLLVADGLSGKGRNWMQSNYYYNQQQSSYYIPELNQFCSGGEFGKPTVSGLVFNDVVVSKDGVMGIDGSIPASLEAEQEVSHSLTFDLSKISSVLIPDRKKLRVIAMVLDRNGQVLNCAKDEVNDGFETSAVEGIESADNAPVEFYNLNGMKVAEPTEGIYIRRQGSKAEKVIVK